jgi:hypothetical protein
MERAKQARKAATSTQSKTEIVLASQQVEDEELPDPTTLPRFVPTWNGSATEVPHAVQTAKSVSQFLIGKGGLLSEDVSFETLDKWVDLCMEAAETYGNLPLVTAWRRGVYALTSDCSRSNRRRTPRFSRSQS